jgi:hypothetical protein
VSEQGITIGEIGRRLAAMEATQRERHEENGARLDRIDDKLAQINGRVGRGEERLNAHDRELRDVKRDRQAVIGDRREGESLTVRITPKMWAALAAAWSGLMLLAQMLGPLVTKLLGVQP